MRSAHGLVLGILLAACTFGVRAQVPPSGQTPEKPGAPAKKSAAPTPKPTGQAPAPAKPATPAAKPAVPAAKQAGQALTGAGKPAAKPAARAAAKSAPKTSATPGKPGGKPAAAAKKPAKAAAKARAAKTPKKTVKPRAAESETRVARRDPFESLIGRQRNASEAAKNLPPGKAGLQVSTLRLDGVVRAPNGMIAVVTNPQSRTYFLREGDQLYDGRVEKITMDGVSFHEMGKDAFGKPVEREVSKRMYSSPGERQ